MKNNSLIITGASGFIGSQLMSFIKTLGVPCLGFSRQKNHNNLQWTENYLDIGSKIDKNQVCIHLAGNNNVNSTDDSEIKITEYLSDFFGTNLLYISSSYIYGDNHKSLITESDDIGAINKYSRRKICCEDAVLKNSGGILRLSNVYGTGMANNIFNHIYKEFMCENNMVKINNALNIRDFIHVSDVCSAIIAYINDIKPDIYNISTGKATSIKDLCDIFARNLNVSKTEYRIESVTEDNTMLVLDSNKFRKRYNWKHKIDINFGIASWVEDYKRELSNVK